MDKNKVNEITSSLETAFINSNIQSNLALRPSFVTNNYDMGNKVLTTVVDQLNDCSEFIISVAFITRSGLTPLLQVLKDLEERQIPGKILTTNYLTFSEPEALIKLSNFKNIELRMFRVNSLEDPGFHTKGYIFRKGQLYQMVIGSSNLTQSALTRNKEWNVKLISTEQGEMVQSVLAEFQRLWNQSDPLDEWIEQYTEIYQQQKLNAKSTKVPTLAQYRLRPNAMQVEFVHNLKQLQSIGQQKALLISATGTGKTYAAAFAIQDNRPKRMLFIVHREQILKQAMESFHNVLGDTKSLGLLSGTTKQYDADYLFATIQMMSKPEVLQSFAPYEFDFIIIDETHRSGAESYQRIFQYFKPKFILGMTATPERSDGYDIYQLFDHNIAYEIRLQQAMEENMLCPFHYFGISELAIDGQAIDDFTEFRYLVSEQRVDNIIDKINYYGHSGERVKGLIFCSRKEEAKHLSAIFNQKGFSTIALCGDNSQEEREDAINRLEQDQKEGALDYIFTVDIFNEGVDIPAINQVVMLRPTESAIIFVQQLGRGLRKYREKEFVVIIDFIGNYTKNFLIPIALSGDRTYNKDSLRRYVAEGTRVIPGSSTVNFDRISKKKIYESIDNANFNDIKLIKESYQNLKVKLGHIPKLSEFDEFGSIDVVRIFDNNSLGSYYKFLEKYEKEYTTRLNAKEQKFIEFISKKFASGKRVHELELIKRMLVYEHGLMNVLSKTLESEYCIEVNEKTITNIVNIMTNQFTSGSAKATYEDCIFLEEDHGDYKTAKAFKEMLGNQEFYDMVCEIVEFGLHRNKINYGKRYKNTNFELYQKYTYEDVCRLLEWEKGEVALNIGGYKYDKKTKTYPVFINYDKNEDVSATINYEDRFLSPYELIALSKSGRTPQSEDVMTAYRAKELGVDMELFVRKNKDDKISKEFYYLGKITAVGTPETIVMRDTNKTAVEIMYRLDTPVREDIYEYIVQA